MATTKICTKCGESFTKDGFYTDSRATDGLRSSCKMCYRIVNNRCKKTEKGKESRRKGDKKRREKYPEKYAARNVVSHAIRDGKLIRQPCKVFDCYEMGEAHHEDYSKPLDIVWLCKEHHTKLHRREKLCQEY